MTLIKPLFSLIVFISLFIGCSNDMNDEKESRPKTQIDFEIIASEKTLPANFMKLLLKERQHPISNI